MVTVKELITQLMQYEPDTPVIVEVNHDEYGPLEYNLGIEFDGRQIIITPED